MDEETLRQVEQIIGHKFSDSNLLAKALTHSSVASERILSNERLEFLGDAILGLVICQVLFERFAGHMEGDLTKMKSMLVSREICAQISRQLGLQKFLKVGKGMIANRALSGSLAAGVLEAVIGAIYLDGGLDTVQNFILRTFASSIDHAQEEQAQGNYKSLLQQYAQEHSNITPVYVLLDEKGPDHDKCFELGAVLGERHFPSAWGTNKKEAEQKAAFNALVELGVLENTSLETEN